MVDTMRGVPAARGLEPRPRAGGATQSDLRGHNLAAITRLLSGARSPLSRADIAQSSGMGRATVSRLTQELIDAALVTEMAPIGTEQRGRPATPLQIARRTVAGIGLEVNVWYVAARALDLAGDVLGQFRISGDFAHQPAADTLRLLGDEAARLVVRLRAEHIDVAGACLAIPGMVSEDGGDVAVAPNLDWRDLRPLDHLGADWTASHVPTAARNDADLRATAEACVRPGRLVEDASFLYVAGDIGIGGALVREGQIDSGEHGWAGEVGHVSVEPDGPPCHCGSTGCLETYAGQASLMAAAGLSPRDDVDALIARLAAGDATAARAVARAGWALGVAIANVLNVADLSRVVLGTSLGRLLPWLEEPMNAQLRRRVLGAGRRDLVVTQGAILDAPACTGGALAVLNGIVDDPAGYVAARSAAGSRR